MIPSDVLRRVAAFAPVPLFHRVNREGRAWALPRWRRACRDRLAAVWEPPGRCCLCDSVVEPLRYLEGYCVNCLWRNDSWSNVSQWAPETRLLAHP